MSGWDPAGLRCELMPRMPYVGQLDLKIMGRVPGTVEHGQIQTGT